MRDLKLENIARRAVRHELMMGRMVRPETCSECGKNPGFAKDGRSLIQAHHYNGHENKLDIIWLCVQCHRDASPKANGEKNGWYAKPEARSVTSKGGQALSDEQVMDAYTSKEPRAALAKRLGVNECVIHDITAGRHYGHLTGGKSRTQLKLEAAYAQGKADGRAEAIKELAAPIWPTSEPPAPITAAMHEAATIGRGLWRAKSDGTMEQIPYAETLAEPPATVDDEVVEIQRRHDEADKTFPNAIRAHADRATLLTKLRQRTGSGITPDEWRIWFGRQDPSVFLTPTRFATAVTEFITGKKG